MSLPRTVLVLGVASLLTDLSSEMIFPLLPAFLAVLGVGAIALGLMEGAAESTASLLKVVSGALADRMPRRKPLVVAGYAISGTARPLIGLATIWPVVLVLRLVDRFGKGLRTSPRDALIADVTVESQRGRAYGLQRAMDNAGAVLGPLAAATLLGLGLSLREVFWCAALPAAMVVVVLALGVRERPRVLPAATSGKPPNAGLADLGRDFRVLLGIVVVFALGNSSDAFLLLRLGQAGLSNAEVAYAWTAHSAVRATAVYVGGHLADRFDKTRLMAAGWAVHAAIYGMMALFDEPAALVVALIAYGVHYGATEPTERALVAELAPPAFRGSAFGWFHGAIGLSALPASALFGWLWSELGAPGAFGFGAGLALTAGVLLLLAFGKSNR